MKSELIAIMEEIKGIEAQVKAAHVEIEGLIDSTNKYCPVKIGDIVDVTGYSHNGKKMIINGITFCHKSDGGYYGIWMEDVGWMISGKVIRKDGTPGSQTGCHAIYLQEAQ